MKKRSCVVSIIGRPNVGKSTIFNRLMRQSFKVMTHDQPGVTRDRHYSIANFESKAGEKSQDTILVDTGGFYPEKIEEQKQLGKRKTAEPFFNIMADQAKIAIDESDLVLMVVDIREGMIPFDKSICDYIRTTKKKMWLLVNKFDTDKQYGEEADFYSLGLKEDEFFMLSAEHNRGLETLRNSLYDFVEDFQTMDEEEIQKGVTPNHDVVSNIALVGAPNAGKSTLLNQLIGSQRALVSDIAGTTVDPIEGYFDIYFGKDAEVLSAQENEFRKTNTDLLEEFDDFTAEMEEAEVLAYNELPSDIKDANDIEDDESEMVVSEEVGSDDFYNVEDLENSLSAAEGEEISETGAEEEKTEIPYNPFRSVKLVDTAGIRKQKVVHGFIEEQSVYRSLKSITQADVVIFMIDATKGITHQDRRLCDIALEKGKSLIICLNKVDLISDKINDPKKKRDWLLDLRDSIPWLSFCELITISAKKGKYISTLKESLRKTVLVRHKKVTTGNLNKAVSALVNRNPVMLARAEGVPFKVKYASMIKSTPPTFLLFTNKSKGIPPNYRKYLTNGLRREFQMLNTPLHLIFRTTTDIKKRLKRAEAQ